MKTKYLRIIAIPALAFVVLTLPVCAQLVPASVGFPVITQNGSASALNQNTVSAFDLEDVSISFPVSTTGVDLSPTALNGTVTTPSGVTTTGTASGNVLPYDSANLTFPNINETVDQGQTQTAMSYSQNNGTAESTYPFVGVGGVSLPTLAL
jgi:hypothetical protein